MRGLVFLFSLPLWMILSATMAIAQMETVSMTVSFRERIALPPGARLDVGLLQVEPAATKSASIASQRFAITNVPMTVSLTYDPQIVEEESRYAVSAVIRSPDGKQMFQGTRPLGSLDASPAAVDMMLAMLPEGDSTIAVPRRISGVAWTVTEVFGEAWQNDDPATLVIDDEMNFAIFGGCNRFSGPIWASGGDFSFPENIAGTMMACPDGVEALERRFLAALIRVFDYVRYGAGLVMMDAEGRAVLHFVETPE